MILGLTGGYCAGKNVLAGMLAERGFVEIDVDKLGHAALEATAKEVAALLGPSVIDASGKPIRRAIGALVFADQGLLERYEAIVHPAMISLLDGRIDDIVASGQNVCVNAAVLYKLPTAKRCDAIIELRAPLCARVARGRKRDGLGLFAVLKRINGQRGLFAARKRPEGVPVFVIRNPGTREGLARALERTLMRIPQTATR